MESFQLGVRKCVVECIAIIKSRMNERAGNGGCSCDVDGVSDAA